MNKTRIIIRQFHRHDASIEQLLAVAYANLDKFPGEQGRDVPICHDFQHVVGKTTCINTDFVENPDIYYAVRGKRKYKSRMIRGVEPQDCSCVTMIVDKYRWEHNADEDVLFLQVITSYIGTRSPREATELAFKFSVGRFDFTPAEEAEAREYWSHHALLAEPDAA